MATKRDLVEAHSFSRRRLVTAFVSGAPGGREVEPVRPGRTIVGGLALSVLLVLGALIAGVFAPRIPEDWDKVGLVVSKDDGGLYVITDADHPVLRPVINVTSAKLILGDAAADPTPLPSSFIRSKNPGEDIGILGAPHDVPAPDRMIDTGWTACTDTGRGIQVNVSTQSTTRAAGDQAVVVESGGRFFLVGQVATADGRGYRSLLYPLPDDVGARDNMLLAVGLAASVEHVTVPEAWLGLFPAGPALEWASFTLPGAGERPSYVGAGSGLGSDFRVGDLVKLDSGTDVVLTRDGPADLNPFAEGVYENLPGSRRPTVRHAASVAVGRAGTPFPDVWPVTELTPWVGEACVQLEAAVDADPWAQLVGTPGPDASAGQVAEGDSAVRVDPGAGAHVLSGDWQSGSGAPFLIDSLGRAYPLVGQAASQLGYAPQQAPVVPGGWVGLFQPGVPLSPEAALCPPEPGKGRTCL